MLCFGMPVSASGSREVMNTKILCMSNSELGYTLLTDICASKNVQESLKQSQVQTKDLKVYARPSLGERCVVDIILTYMAVIPVSGPFY